jgi:lipopolysaccharide export system permease protein
MEILDRYIGKAMVVSVITVLAVLIALDTVISFAGEAMNIGRANYDIWSAISYVGLNIPQKAYLLFPTVALLATMLSLGGLAGNSELIAMRSAGVSVSRIAWAVLKTGMVITILVVIVGEFVAPKAVQYAKLIRVNAMNKKISLNTDFGLWARDGANYIHVRRVEEDDRLVGISVYIYDKQQQLQETLSSPYAEYQGGHWVMYDVTKRTISDKTIKQDFYATMDWYTQLKPDVVNVVSVTPENLSIVKLKGYIEYLKINGLNSKEYELIFWSKLIAPVTVAAMIILAVPFVFGSLRSVGLGQRIIVGFILGLGFFVFSRLVGNAGLIYIDYAWIPAILPTLVVLGISIFLLKRTR